MSQFEWMHALANGMLLAFVIIMLAMYYFSD